METPRVTENVSSGNANGMKLTRRGQGVRQNVQLDFAEADGAESGHVCALCRALSQPIHPIHPMRNNAEADGVREAGDVDEAGGVDLELDEADDNINNNNFIKSLGPLIECPKCNLPCIKKTAKYRRRHLKRLSNGKLFCDCKCKCCPGNKEEAEASEGHKEFVVEKDLPFKKKREITERFHRWVQEATVSLLRFYGDKVICSIKQQMEIGDYLQAAIRAHPDVVKKLRDVMEWGEFARWGEEAPPSWLSADEPLDDFEYGFLRDIHFAELAEFLKPGISICDHFMQQFEDDQFSRRCKSLLTNLIRLFEDFAAPGPAWMESSCQAASLAFYRKMRRVRSLFGADAKFANWDSERIHHFIEEMSTEDLTEDLPDDRVVSEHLSDAFKDHELDTVFDLENVGDFDKLFKIYLEAKGVQRKHLQCMQAPMNFFETLDADEKAEVCFEWKFVLRHLFDDWKKDVEDKFGLLHTNKN